MLDVPTSLAHKFSLQQTWTNPCLLQSAHHWLEESMAQDLLKTWTHESGPQLVDQLGLKVFFLLLRRIAPR
jgi:hypothetical protein